MGEKAERVEGVSPAEPATKKLTPEYAGRLLFLITKFAQDDTDLQLSKKIMSYLHTDQPDWRIEDKEAVRAAATSIFYRFFFSTPPTSEDQRVDSQMHSTGRLATTPITKASVDMNLSMELDYMTGEFNGKAVHDKRKLIAQLTDRLIQRDFKYTLVPRPRAEPDPTHHNTDPWASTLIEYAMRGRGTGSPELNRMFSEIRAHILEERRSDPALLRMIDGYNTHHPTTPFAFDPIA